MNLMGDITRSYEAGIHLRMHIFDLTNKVNRDQIGIFTFNLVDHLIDWSNFRPTPKFITINARILYGSLAELSELVRDPLKGVKPAIKRKRKIGASGIRTLDVEERSGRQGHLMVSRDKFIRDVTSLATTAGKAIHEFIHGKASKYWSLNPRRDEERRLWVLNDEGLYRLHKQSGLSLTAFIKQWKDTIDSVIDNVTSGQEQAHYLEYKKYPRGSQNPGRFELERLRRGEWSLIDNKYGFALIFNSKRAAERARAFVNAYVLKHGDINFDSFPFDINDLFVDLPSEV